MAPLSRAAQKLPASQAAVRTLSVSSLAEALSRTHVGWVSAGRVSSAANAASLKPVVKRTSSETVAASAPLRDIPPLHQNGDGAWSWEEAQGAEWGNSTEEMLARGRSIETLSAVESFLVQKGSWPGGSTASPPENAQDRPERSRKVGGKVVRRQKDRWAVARTPEAQERWNTQADEVIALLRHTPSEQGVDASPILDPLRAKTGRNVFNRAIQKLAAAKDLDTALFVFEWMKQQREDCQPNAATYAQVIRAAAQANKPGKAVGVFEEMRASGLSPDLYVFSALISGYARAGMYKQALELLDQMRERGVRPDLVVYTTVLNACVKGGLRAGRILELYADVSGQSSCARSRDPYHSDL